MQTMRTEPARIISQGAATVTALVTALIALALGFGWVDWTSEQVTLIMGVLAAVSALVVGAITRGKVWSPTGVDGVVEEASSLAAETQGGLDSMSDEGEPSDEEGEEEEPDDEEFAEANLIDAAEGMVDTQVLP